MKKEWITPSIEDLTIQATAHKGHGGHGDGPVGCPEEDTSGGEGIFGPGVDDTPGDPSKPPKQDGDKKPGWDGTLQGKH